MAGLNHTIVWCTDKQRSAEFLTGVLGLPPARVFFHFLVVDLANGVSLDFYEREGAVSPQHYAFLVTTKSSTRRSSGLLETASNIGPIRREVSRVRSTRISAGAGSISRTPTTICWS